MRHPLYRPERRGAILPMVCVSMVVLIGFLALAIDLGIFFTARSQCQNAADSSAMAGARTINGDTTANNNYANVEPKAREAARANYVMGQLIGDGQVTVNIGSYTYDTAQQKFVPNYISKPANDNWSLVQSRVTYQGKTIFGWIFRMNQFSTQATSTAVHRPRDVAIILDFSGSMSFDSLLGIPFSGDRSMSNNPDPVFPKFGHYQDTGSAALQNTNSPFTSLGGNIYGPANIAMDTTGGTKMVDDFYQHASGGTGTRAFTSAGAGNSEGYVAGDRPLKTSNNTGANYAKTLGEIVGSQPNAAWESSTSTGGYRSVTGTAFNGWTQGPNYWGKTFFIWPPDRRTPAGTDPSSGSYVPGDWRYRFFLRGDGAAFDGDNRRLWDSSGNWRVPSSTTYRINYNAILNWIRLAGPSVFPTRVRAGRIVYYDAIPTSIATSGFPPSFPSNKNERFWKDYIDHVLGVKQSSSGGSYSLVLDQTGYGDNFRWDSPGSNPSIRISNKPSNAYLDYADNPRRPRTQFWFGPMTFLDFIKNYNQNRFWNPGTCQESPTITCKLGMQGALQDIQKNHPNDHVAVIYFSDPLTSASDTSGRFNRARVPLGRDYQRMLDSLWYPPWTIDNPGQEITPYDADSNGVAHIRETPHGNGATCPAMALMLAYNQFSGNSSLRTNAPAPFPTGLAGGLGRKGATKMIVLETDGMANTRASASFTNQGAYDSYYRVRQDSGEYPSNSGVAVDQQVFDICNQICALDTASSPGYSTGARPVIIHCIAFGSLFEPTTADPDKSAALTLLQNIQYIGGKAGGEQPTPATPLATYKVITGSQSQRVTRLQQALSAIMQGGIQVNMIE